MQQGPAHQPAISEIFQKLLPKGKSWKCEQSLWSGMSIGWWLRPMCRCKTFWCAGATGSLPSARRRAATTQWCWLLRLAQGKYHCIWQELKIRQTHKSTQFQSSVYLSNLFFVIPSNAVGHMEPPCGRMVVLQSLGRWWDTCTFMLQLQTSIPAGKSRAGPKRRQEVQQSDRCDGCGEHWMCHPVSRQWLLPAECQQKIAMFLKHPSSSS